MIRIRRLFVVVLAAGVAFSVLPGSPADVDAANRNNNRNNKNKNRNKPQKRNTAGMKAMVAASKRALADAQARAASAQMRMQDFNGKIQASNTALQNARSAAANATSRLKDIQEEIEAKQSADSDFAKATAAYRKAEQEFQIARKRVYESPSYKAKYRAAMGSASRATLLPKVKKEAEEKDTEYQQAKLLLEKTRHDYEGLRMKLYGANSDWVATAKQARETRKHEAEAYKRLKASLVSRGIASTNLSKANREGALAAATIKKGEAAIKSADAYNKRVEEEWRRRQRNNNNRYRR